MGFFSFKTSDTEESIWNVSSGCEVRPVYLLQPHGQAPVCEHEYEGYGVFAGVDCFVWLARNNFDAEKLKAYSEDDLRDIGLSRTGHAIRLGDGRIFNVFHNRQALFDLAGLDVIHFDGTWAEVIPELGKSANDLISTGEAEQVGIADLIGQWKFPLKFSFDPNARYEDLPAAQDCPHQGCTPPRSKARRSHPSM